MDFIYQANRIYAMDETGKTIAEATFPTVGNQLVDINHTYVDDCLRGQGIAGQLMAAVAERLRTQQKKARLTCPYAAEWFSKHSQYGDVLEKRL